MHDHELRELYRAETEFFRELTKILKHQFPRKAESLISQIEVGGLDMGAPASIHLNSTTAQVTFQEFDGPNGTGNPLPPVGPMSYASDTPATLTVDPASGKISPVAVGTATITTTDTGNGLSDTNLVTVVADTAESLVASITP